MEPKIEVIERKSTGVGSLIELLLIDEYVLCIRTRDARRNVDGKDITVLRKLFGSQCKYLDGAVVEIIRRARALGQVAPVTFAHSMKSTRLKRRNERLAGQNQIIEALLEDHESMIRALSYESPHLSNEQDDTDTAVFAAGLAGQHLEMAGALREWL
ncbi:MAG TPA: hypothetical protein VIS48_10690 [Candidatus Kryptonia bacterium]